MHYVIGSLLKQKPPEHNNILLDMIKVINHIKVHSINSCPFVQLGKRMDAEYTYLLSVHKWEVFLMVD